MHRDFGVCNACNLAKWIQIQTPLALCFFNKFFFCFLAAKKERQQQRKKKDPYFLSHMGSQTCGFLITQLKPCSCPTTQSIGVYTCWQVYEQQLNVRIGFDVLVRLVNSWVKKKHYLQGSQTFMGLFCPRHPSPPPIKISPSYKSISPLYDLVVVVCSVPKFSHSKKKF